jgi:DNA-directed RNA polymerase subunit RPC12/RpoP
MACLRCGTKKLAGGKVLNVKGQVVYLCAPCVRKMTKKWWQFWK